MPLRLLACIDPLLNRLATPARWSVRRWWDPERLDTSSAIVYLRHRIAVGACCTGHVQWVNSLEKENQHAAASFAGTFASHLVLLADSQTKR